MHPTMYVFSLSWNPSGPLRRVSLWTVSLTNLCCRGLLRLHSTFNVSILRTLIKEKIERKNYVNSCFFFWKFYFKCIVKYLYSQKSFTLKKKKKKLTSFSHFFLKWNKWIYFINLLIIYEDIQKNKCSSFQNLCHSLRYTGGGKIYFV